MQRMLGAIWSQIRYKIILPYLALTLIVMMAGSAIALGLVWSSFEERIANQLAQLGRNTTDALVRRERNHLDWLRVIAFAGADTENDIPAVADAISSRDRTAVEKALTNPYQYGVGTAILNFDRMIAFDRDGRTLVDWLRVDEAPNKPPLSIEGSDLSQATFVKQIITGQLTDGADKSSGLITFLPDTQPYFYTSVPVKQGETIVGGLLIAIKTDRLLLSLERDSRVPGTTTFYNLQGEAIGSTLVSRSELPTVRMPDQARMPLEQGQASSIFNVEVRGRAYEQVYSPLAIANQQVGYFSVGLAREYELQPLLTNRNAIIALAIVLTLGSIWLGYWVARNITRPLTSLVATAEAVTHGDLERRTEIQSIDELGRLAQAFNQMTEHLLRLYRASLDLSATIEVESVLTVAARTVRSFVDGTEVLALLNERGVWRYHMGAEAPSYLGALSNLRFSGSDPLLRELTQRHTPRILACADEPRLATTGLSNIAGFETLMLTPLIVQGQPAGMLIFGHRFPDAFNGAVEPTLMAVSNMAASVLYNAVLFSRVHAEASERQAILQSIADGVIVCDQQRNIVLVNDAAERMLNLHDWHIVRRNFSEVPLKKIDVEQDLFGSKEAEIDHYQLGEKILRMSNAPLIAEDSRALGEVIVLHDISAEAAIDQAKTKFIEVISHELRTPLTTILGFLDLMLRGSFGELAADQRDILDSVRMRGEQMKDLVNNVIMVASIQANTLRVEIEPQDLWIAVDNTVTPLRRAFAKKGLTLDNQLPEDLPRILADREHLRLVLTQLLDNARRYTQTGGVTISATRYADTVELHIADTGPGIPTEEIGRLFTRFHRIEGNNSPERGIGLGLAITRQLIERQGGQVWAESEIGRGSIFTIAFPIVNEHADADAVTGRDNADATA